MDSGSSSNSPAPFLIKTYEMIDDPLTNPIVSWSQSGCSFVVWNPPDFAQHLLPKYFKHNNFSSFVRQLNTYGFRKIDPDQWEFANEEFIRGQRHLLSNIRRRKPIHSHSLQNQIGNVSPLTDPERKEYEDKIRKLKQEKTFLQLELHRNETEKRAFEGQIVSYSERLQSMERRQMELVSFLSQLAKKPEFESILMQQPDYNNKKRRLFESGDFSVDNSDEGLMKTESVEKLDSSIRTLEEFLYGERENWCHQRNDFRLVEPSSPTIVQELSASSVDGETCSPRSHPSTARSMDIPSSPELAVVAHGNVESSPKSPEVESKSVQTNDHFWEYFLTEAPGIEEPGKRVDPSGDKGRRTGGVKDERDENGWLNSSVIHDLTMHMEHLAPAGRT